MIKAVIFDLFETLITETNNVKITSFKIAERLKVPYDEYKKLGFRVFLKPSFLAKIKY